jgi:hypothetical protein
MVRLASFRPQLLYAAPSHPIIVSGGRLYVHSLCMRHQVTGCASLARWTIRPCQAGTLRTGGLYVVQIRYRSEGSELGPVKVVQPGDEDYRIHYEGQGSKCVPALDLPVTAGL